MIYPIANISNLKALLLVTSFWILSQSTANADIFENWKLVQKDPEKIAFETKSREARFVFGIVDEQDKTITSRMYAQAMLDKYKGTNLKPIPKIKGWEFSFVSDLPCAVVVAKNMKGFEVMMLCGKATINETRELIKVAKSQLIK